MNNEMLTLQCFFTECHKVTTLNCSEKRNSYGCSIKLIIKDASIAQLRHAK